MPFRVICHKYPSPTRRLYVAEWHETLTAALDAMYEHQQRPWNSVALVPATQEPLPIVSYDVEMKSKQRGAYKTAATHTPQLILF